MTEQIPTPNTRRPRTARMRVVKAATHSPAVSPEPFSSDERALVSAQVDTAQVDIAQEEVHTRLLVRGHPHPPAPVIPRPLSGQQLRSRHIGLTLGALVLLGGALVTTTAHLGRSLAPARVPSEAWWGASAGSLGYGGGAAPGVQAPGSAGLPVLHTPPVQAPPASTQPPSEPPPSGGTILPAPLAPWPPADQFAVAPPGYISHEQGEPPGDPYYWAYGQCTWWAAWQRRDENFLRLGNAWQWPDSSQARGYRVGEVPVAGATVTFAPGTEGAGGGGHVAHVLAVYPDGWFLVSEMNFYWNGGGWGRVDYRYAYTTWGVAFIY